MELLFFRSLWGLFEDGVETALEEVSRSGFDGAEVYIPWIEETPDQLAGLMSKHNLKLIAQVSSEGSGLDEHLEDYRKNLEKAARYNPLFIASHTGKGYFNLEDNLKFFKLAARMADDSGINTIHETHRGRALFSTLTTKQIVERLPDIRMTADFSHWCCVHESLLEDQGDFLAQAIPHIDHIHARVGHAEGPQVSDPRAPEWKTALDAHLSWWDSIVAGHRERGSSRLTITPEFGPEPYVPAAPYTNRPLTDIHEINIYLKGFLKDRYNNP
jgi:sugar phosphate isomerase/epimerase